MCVYRRGPGEDWENRKGGGGGNKRKMENIESNMAPYPPPLAYIGPL